MDEILSIKNLKVSFGQTVAVRDVCLSVHAGEILALVGESGSGKSVTAQAALRLNQGAETSADVLTLAGRDMLTATEREMDQLRGSAASMVFQDPMTCLNPSMRVGKQITERLYRKEGLSRAACRAEAVRLLEQVRISDAALRARQYPHQLSGGMRQRVMIAMALACKPQLLIADEPTTALDVTTQIQILKLLANIRSETGTAVLLITHDLSVVANLADRVAVMHAGSIVEACDVKALFDGAQHPYTRALMADAIRQDAQRSVLPREQGNGAAPACSYAKHCRLCMNICLREAPPMLSAGQGHSAACWRLHDRAPKERTDGDIS